jgi:SMC interacting uncharacterized protein involved in chromosome segregation
VAGKKPRKHSSPEIDWELDEIARAAKKVEPRDQAELRGELARKLLVLKTRRRIGIRNWRAYVKKFLKNKTNSWLRDRRQREKRRVSLDRWHEEEGFEEGLPLEMVKRLSKDEGDFGIAFKQLWEALGPEFQRFCLVLAQKEENQTAVAKNLRIHRNTVRLWMKKIQAILQKHGYGGL